MVPTDLPVYMADVPDYEVRDGQMHITLGSFEVVMPVSVYERACARGTVAIKRWRSCVFPRAEKVEHAPLN